MRPSRRYLRLLPAVIAVGTLLLGLKGEGIVHAALAQEQTGGTGDVAVLSQDTAPLAQDVAEDDSGNASAGQVDVLTSLSKRRQALDAREAEIRTREDLLAATEKRVDGKIATLKQLQDQINTLLGVRDAEQQKQVASLVKTYSAMKPKDAARIFNTLADDVMLPVAQAMKSDVLAPILANMNSDAAQKLTVRLANRLKLPETAAPALTPTSAPAPLGTTPGDAALAPAQAAAGTPQQQGQAPQGKPAGNKS